jgi:type IV secretory pathway TrbF-like protein
MPSAPATATAAAPPSTFPKATADVQTTLHPLRQIARARDALSTRRAGLGRAHRLRARSGQELAADGLRLAGLSPGFAAALVWQSAQGTIVPWVVQVDRLGQAQAVAPADADYRRPIRRSPSTSRASSSRSARIPADPIIVRQNWLRAYDFTTDRGAMALNDYARANDPFTGRQAAGRRRRLQRHPRLARTASASPGSSAATRTASSPRPTRWTAILTIVVQPPRNADRLRANPLGIYVNAINWSRELGQ